ncbi:Uncharacterised protein [Streptococcus criceti]|uniref:Uncharacterized protein n=1 Tax=Streptococcus criceti HS-6 TaxID=873449 RepID=G5JNT0_STRCG|nr:hypothetical protein [Streptococcus criceti]EHI74010.1 hypothetical protein STRCR_0243 [Streptococcus criceti HS-6]SUN41741.1 Uncharacterised protein [Streptococcus criceti]
MNHISRIKRKYFWVSLAIVVGYYFFSMIGFILYSAKIIATPQILGAITFIVLLIVIRVTRLNYLKSINNVLLEHIALADYRAYLETKAFITKKRRNQQELSLASLDFLEGNFEDCLNRLSGVYSNIERDKSRSGVDLKLLYYRYQFMSSIFSHQEINFEMIEQEMNSLKVRNQSLKRQVLEENRALYDIVHNKANNTYFDEHTPKNKLQQLQYLYYSALNAELEGDDVNKVRQLYTSLSNENPRLFFVKEAKQYLKETI